ncbi:hypothetical protein FVE85_9544 [Porphyridium purpureum]|uniref:Uncharacterized protein n=1 Tax=Porphyridium purpureum TaxID=35688 RepID=A0A5J4YIN1_PORPP|nr:hypothetical protein FVE85_9544 [Porphyridium purpureum]|eukprot:POR3874..scf261_15
MSQTVQDLICRGLLPLVVKPGPVESGSRLWFGRSLNIYRRHLTCGRLFKVHRRDLSARLANCTMTKGVCARLMPCWTWVAWMAYAEQSQECVYSVMAEICKFLQMFFFFTHRSACALGIVEYLLLQGKAEALARSFGFRQLLHRSLWERLKYHKNSSSNHVPLPRFNSLEEDGEAIEWVLHG